MAVNGLDKNDNERILAVKKVMRKSLKNYWKEITDAKEITIDISNEVAPTFLCPILNWCYENKITRWNLYGILTSDRAEQIQEFVNLFVTTQNRYLQLSRK